MIEVAQHMTLVVGYDIVATNPSCPGIAVGRTASLPLTYARASTSSSTKEKGVDGRNKSGHDERG
jgi:hypothetical protein